MIGVWCGIMQFVFMKDWIGGYKRFFIHFGNEATEIFVSRGLDQA